MLVLTRKKDESIMIGEEIEIVVLEISSTQVRLGVKAPKNCAIYRKEIFTAIQEENRRAAQQHATMVILEKEIKALFAKKQGDTE
jgi:carbon storage regulator